MMTNTKFIWLFVFCLMTMQLWGQSDTTKTQGEVLSGEIVIEKDKKITLPQADKIYLRSNPMTLSNGPLNQTFKAFEPSMVWPEYKSDVPFQKFNEQYPISEYQNYVRFGYGNYKSWLLESGIFHSFGAWKTGASINYETFKTGPVNDENSGNSAGSIQISSNYHANSLTINTQIEFKRSRFNYYGNTDRINTGFNPNAVDDGVINEFKVGIGASFDKNDLKWTFKPSFSQLNHAIDPSNEQNKETSIAVISGLNYLLKDELSAGLGIDFYSGKYDGGITYSRSLLNLKPWISYELNNLNVKAGFTISTNSVGSNTQTGFYPNVNADLSLSENWTLFGVLSGGQKWNSLGNILEGNEFLDDSLAILNIETNFSFGGGIKGKPLSTVLLESSITYSSLNGLPFFTPSPGDSTKYTLSYDTDNINLTKLKASASYMPGTTSLYRASIELNAYSVESLDRAWHQPTFVFKAFTSHNIQEKLILSSHLTSMGGIRAPANVDFGYVNLKAFIDMGVGVKYLISQRASAFIDVNNLLNNEYERYLGYPTRGLAFKIGAQYRF
ncbi:hypothetical protein [Ekhidna sp.]|uniref:hypothetical protein n=2 Tax=Ekhidna sp. TaxID=2608089 RepID=UPI00329A2082